MSHIEKEEQIENYLNELRRKVLLRAPLQDRLIVLRHLGRLSEEWKNDLEEHEKERSCEIEKELKSLLSSKTNEKKIDDLVTELKDFATISPSIEKLRQAGIGYWKNARQEKEKAEKDARLKQEQAELDTIRMSADITRKSPDDAEFAYRRALEKLDGTHWEHPEANTLRQEIEDMSAREATRREFQGILDEIETHKPNENFFVQPSRFFEDARRNWKEKSNTETPPADLAAKAAVILKKWEEIRTKNRWLLIKIGSAVGSIAVLSLVIFVSTYLMYMVPYERKSVELVSSFVQTVEKIPKSNDIDVQINQAEQLYASLEKDYPAKTKSPDVITAKVNRDTYIIKRRKQFEDQCQIIEKSIEKATNIPEEYKPEFLDNNALTRATELATESEKKEVIQPCERTFAEIRRIANAQVDERRALEARIKENTRQNEFQSLCQRIKESIKEATKNPDKFDPKKLDEISLKKATELAKEEETDTVDRFYQQFINVRNIAAKQQQSEIEREFDGIYKKALASYEDASKNSDSLDESLLDNNALDVAVGFLGRISAQKELEVKTLQTNFDKLKREATKQRSERLNVYIAATTQDWLNVISNDNKALYTIKITQVEALVADLKRQNIQTANDEDQGRPTNSEVKDKAVFLFSGVSKSLDEFRYLASLEIDLLKVTESVGDRRDFTDSLRAFQKKYPEVRGNESIAEFLQQGDEYWSPIQIWNHFVERYAQEVGSAPITPEKTKEIAAFIANHEKTLQYIPEFSSLKYRYQVPKTDVAIFPADTIKQKIAPFAQKKLWYAITKTGQYCYFDRKPVLGKNTFYIAPPVIRGGSATLEQEDVDKIALAPQIDLVSIIGERLAPISFEIRKRIRNNTTRCALMLFALFWTAKAPIRLSSALFWTTSFRLLCKATYSFLTM